MKLEQQMEIKWKAGLPGRAHSCRKPFVTGSGESWKPSCSQGGSVWEMGPIRPQVPVWERAGA